MTMSTLTAFPSRAAMRAWLTKNHNTATELVLRCFKKHAAKQGVTYAEALDEALCLGWIDGIRRGVDAQSFSVRFTPRRPRSIWSRINIAHVERLMLAGRMKKPGLAAFEARDGRRTGVYSFENQTTLSPAFSRAFRANPSAWAYFQGRPPWYRRTSAHWVMGAKKEETRARRLSMLITCSAQGIPIPPLKRAERGKDRHVRTP
jgi:uncharacterized protein YdeI (YjbR/CyaY-like superfamily)